MKFSKSNIDDWLSFKGINITLYPFQGKWGFYIEDKLRIFYRDNGVGSFHGNKYMDFDIKEYLMWDVSVRISRRNKKIDKIIDHLS